MDVVSVLLAHNAKVEARTKVSDFGLGNDDLLDSHLIFNIGFCF